MLNPFENLVSTVLKLEDIRQVPQLLFVSPIYPDAMIKVRSEVLRMKASRPDVQEIDFIISSPGGLPDVAYRIIRTLRKNFSKVNVIVPFWAKSAATLLSLGASQIVMDEFGEFGPLDMQLAKERDDSPELNVESALNDEHSLSRIETRFKDFYESMFNQLYTAGSFRINKIELSKQLLESATKFYIPLLQQIDPYRLGEKRRKLDIGFQYAKRILLQFNKSSKGSSSTELAEAAHTIAYFLVYECPDHGYVLDYDMMKALLGAETVSKSSVFGEDYKTTLQSVSNWLINQAFVEGRELTFIGFVDTSLLPDEGEEDEVEDTFDEPVEDAEKPAKSETNGSVTFVESADEVVTLSAESKSLATIAAVTNGTNHGTQQEE